jgi:RNA recognition motif-containing protein
MNIYVGNLPFSVTEEMLKQVFAEFGQVASVKIITDAYSGRPKGFGFVEMPDLAEAQRAIEDLNNCSLEGRNIIVNEARPKSDKPQRISRY